MTEFDRTMFLISFVTVCSTIIAQAFGLGLIGCLGVGIVLWQVVRINRWVVMEVIDDRR